LGLQRQQDRSVCAEGPLIVPVAAAADPGGGRAAACHTNDCDYNRLPNRLPDTRRHISASHCYQFAISRDPSVEHCTIRLVRGKPVSKALRTPRSGRDSKFRTALWSSAKELNRPAHPSSAPSTEA
jgi:hypothetical protein